MRLSDKIILDGSVLAFATSAEIMEMANRARESSGEWVEYEGHLARFRARTSQGLFRNVIIERIRDGGSA